jgi:hypothetical protein
MVALELRAGRTLQTPGFKHKPIRKITPDDIGVINLDKSLGDPNGLSMEEIQWAVEKGASSRQDMLDMINAHKELNEWQQ